MNDSTNLPTEGSGDAPSHSTKLVPPPDTAQLISATTALANQIRLAVHAVDAVVDADFSSDLAEELLPGVAGLVHAAVQRPEEIVGSLDELYVAIRTGGRA